MNVVLRFLVLGALLAAAGCKARSSASSAQGYGPAPEERILLVGSGGWRSCGGLGTPTRQRIHDSFMTLENVVARRATVDYVIACLNKVTPAKAHATMMYVANGRPAATVKVPEFLALLRRYVAEARPTKVYLVGHSYGGWLALWLAEQGLPATAVFALDPIDARTCLPTDNFLAGIGLNDPACRRAPEMDFAAQGLAAPAIYQLWQPNGSIHSAPLAVANSRSAKIQVQGPAFYELGLQRLTHQHRLIGSDPAAWTLICQQVFAHQGWAGDDCRAFTVKDPDEFLSSEDDAT